MSAPPAVDDPGSPQSSTSTVKPTCCVPVIFVSLAWPLNWACLPVGQAVLMLITNVSMEIALQKQHGNQGVDYYYLSHAQNRPDAPAWRSFRSEIHRGKLRNGR